MAGEYPLAPWIAQSNTDLMPRAMVAGAQVGNIIADNRRANLAAKFAAQEAEAKRVQEAMRYQGYQDYQRDIANGMDAGEALKRHGAKMYFGQTVFPQVLNAMQRNEDFKTYRDSLNDLKKVSEEEKKRSNLVEEGLTRQLRTVQEANSAETKRKNEAKEKADAETARLTPDMKNILGAQEWRDKAFGEDFLGNMSEADRYDAMAKKLEEQQLSKSFAPTTTERMLQEAESRGVTFSPEEVSDIYRIRSGLKPRAMKHLTEGEFVTRFWKDTKQKALGDSTTKGDHEDWTDKDISDYLKSLYRVLFSIESKPSTSAQPVAPAVKKINSQAEYDALAPGTPYIDSEGKQAVKRK